MSVVLCSSTEKQESISYIPLIDDAGKEMHSEYSHTNSVYCTTFTHTHIACKTRDGFAS